MWLRTTWLSAFKGSNPFPRIPSYKVRKTRKMISKTRLKKKLGRKTNPEKISLIHFLKKQSPFWLRISEYLARPRRKSIKVNISKINRVAKENSIVLVPGKVLSEGELTKPISLSAFSFSEKAKAKLSKASITSLEQLAQKNKKGEHIIVLV